MDYLRAAFISPEMLGLLVPIAFWYYWPESAEFIAREIVDDLKWGFGAALVPLGLIVTCYSFGTDILSPKGARKILLEWPDYWMVKNRIIFAMTFCGIATLIALIGLYWVAKHGSSLGVALIAAGWLSSAISLTTVALARWTAREILSED
jgi:hypothetical protein